MTREELKALGLTDDQIDKVMASHGSVVNATKRELDTVTTDRDDLKAQLFDRDKQLDALKEIDPGALQAEIERLEGVNETTANDAQEKLDKQAFDHALERAIAGVKPATDNSAKAIKALLDTETIKLDGDKLLNLDNQLDALKESDAHLFKSEENPNSPTIVAGGNPNGGGITTLSKGDIMKEPDNIKRQQLIQENSHLFQ